MNYLSAVFRHPLRLLFLFVVISTVLVSPVSASYQSDYEYQKTRYRDTFAEFQVYKKDYVANPTLDNLQKALISARQSIKARNLALMSFTGTTYEALLTSELTELLPVKNRLIETYNYYQLEADKTDSLVELTDFTSMSASFRKVEVHHVRSLKYGQVAFKLVTLLGLNTELQASFDNLTLRLPENVSSLVTQRVGEIRQNLASGRQNLITEISVVIPQYETDQDINIPSNLAKIAAKLNSIRQSHILISDQIIDLEKNYARNN